MRFYYLYEPGLKLAEENSQLVYQGADAKSKSLGAEWIKSNEVALPRRSLRIPRPSRLVKNLLQGEWVSSPRPSDPLIPTGIQTGGNTIAKTGGRRKVGARGSRCKRRGTQK